MSCVSLFTGNVFAVGDMIFDSAEAYEENRRLNDKKERAERLYRRTKDEEEQNRIRLSRLKEEMKQDEKMMQEELKLSQWQLERQDIIDCNALQERLLQSSWNLLRQYKLPDEYRLTQNSLKNFYRAVQEKDLSRRSRMLRVLEDEFRVYPPYWYFRAKTAQESGNLSEAHEFFAKFNEVWRPVLRRDPYKLEAAKFRIQEIAAEGKPIDETRNEILEQLEIVYANTPKDDWADNLFLGVAYFLMGDKSKGMDCIAVNLDFGYEDKISGMLFSQMEKGALDSQEAQNEINRMKLAGLITAMNISDSDTAMLMAMFFEGNNDALESINGRSDNPVVFHALRLIEQSKGNAQNYAKVMEYVKRHDALKNKIHASYSEIVPLVNKYVNENRENAEIFMADMLMYGLGVEQDTKKAEEMFSRLAENGNVYAQFVMIQTHLVPVAPSKKENEVGDVYAGVRKSTQGKLSKEQLEDLYQRGMKYYSGRGVSEDNKKAFEYFLQAAEGGHANAQYRLGQMYRFGWGVKKDMQKAREWFQKAAAQGQGEATWMLNEMNRNRK